jgi:hypothetical protein
LQCDRAVILSDMDAGRIACKMIRASNGYRFVYPLDREPGRKN